MRELVIRKERVHTLLRRHPWIYSGAVRNLDEKFTPGEIVRIVDPAGNFLAAGSVTTERSRIFAKVWSFTQEEIGEEFFRRKLQEALQYRKNVFGGTLPEAFRLVHAESDNLPGLIVDIFQSFAVLQITSGSMEGREMMIAHLLMEELSLEGVYERSDVESRTLEGLENRCRLLAGKEPPPLFTFRENGILFTADPREGHKTGFYLDQRINRLRVMEAAKGCKNVLNCFSYTGGFGLAALKGGAGQVLNIDSSLPALERAKENAALNNFSPEAFQTECADVFAYLRSCRDARKTFDMIILDPPKFAESMAKKEKAARAYKDINLLAIKLLNPGGRLFTYSCSGAMDQELFRKVLYAAALDAKRDLRIAALLTQAPDHPVSIYFPEGAYLKGFYSIVF